MDDRIGEVAVIGDDNEPFGVLIEAPYCKQACASGDEVYGALFNVWRIRAHVAFWLIQDVVDELAGAFYLFAIYGQNVSLLINHVLRKEGDLSIYRHTPFKDELFTFSAGGYPIGGQHFA